MKTTRFTQAIITSATLLFWQAAPVMAAITNPALPESLGADPEKAKSGEAFSTYFVNIWRALIIIGGLAVLFNLINGAIEWITAGGENSKVQHARQKMTQAIIGMVLLVGSFAIISFISNLFGFNLLSATFPSPE